ncbi:hypothetical protein B0T16DRAFT_511917 [Cercophora newfieldiana]|uniref:Trichothecene 3-O-acetyltransferase n=1 Tax=Cercophora newfieldiana TaxID=92897 RepID=A0AA39XYZ0_9PEZI|nr:hypothetical protein B0T16DRAFT_511917 [Cercophora newfieldiana]
MDKAQWMASLTEVMPLTPLDFTAPQGYIPIIFGFPFQGSPEDAISHLERRLARALYQWPCLAGQFIAGGRGVSPKLIYSRSVLTNLDVFPVEVFDAQTLLRPTFPWTFEQLKEEHGPAIAMDKDILCLLPPIVPGPGEGCHPVTLRVNFIEGGILLGLSLHHGIMDGAGVAQFLEYLGGSAQTVNLDFMTDYNFDASHDPTPNPSAPLPAATCKILAIPASRISSLRKEVLELLRASLDENAFVSTTDIVCALTWIFITRARSSRLEPNQVSHFAAAVNIRNKLEDGMEPPMGTDYLGNAFIRVLANSTVGELTGDTDAPVSESDLVMLVADAAYRIRTAIQTLDDPAQVRRHIAIAGAAEHPPSVDLAVRRAIDRGVAGVDASSWIGLGADVNFRIPGTGNGGKPAFVRRAYSPFPGAMSLMPRSGGTRGDANWEIWLALREDDMERLMGQEEMGRFLC